MPLLDQATAAAKLRNLVAAARNVEPEVAERAPAYRDRRTRRQGRQDGAIPAIVRTGCRVRMALGKVTGLEPMSRSRIHAACVGLAAIGLVSALAPAPAMAEAERLTGSRFIDVVGNNTLSGTTASGAAYNLYFLPGGQVTYDDSTGARDRGHWSLDSQGDVCVRFATEQDGRCFAVEMDGRNLTWRGKSDGGEATLRGGVIESFLKPR